MPFKFTANLVFNLFYIASFKLFLFHNKSLSLNSSWWLFAKLHQTVFIESIFLPKSTSEPNHSPNLPFNIVSSICLLVKLSPPATLNFLLYSLKSMLSIKFPNSFVLLNIFFTSRRSNYTFSMVWNRSLFSSDLLWFFRILWYRHWNYESVWISLYCKL